VVVETGAATELGRINELLNHTEQLETPLTRHWPGYVGHNARVVVAVAVFIGFGVLIKDAPLGESLMVAVALARRGHPEGLPAVITIALASAFAAWRRDTRVVRHLPAVETLGATSVIWFG
jgi:Ca2+-transporting ATPase